MGFIPVDMAAVFNTSGKIKPVSFRVKDDLGEEHTYKIQDYTCMTDLSQQIGIYGGLSTLLDRLRYLCHVLVNDHVEIWNLWYFVGECLWYLEEPKR